MANNVFACGNQQEVLTELQSSNDNIFIVGRAKSLYPDYEMTELGVVLDGNAECIQGVVWEVDDDGMEKLDRLLLVDHNRQIITTSEGRAWLYHLKRIPINNTRKKPIMENTGETQALIEDVNNIKKWHHDRNLIEGSDDKSQFAKLIQEAGELSDNICKGKDISDDIGDMIVVLINIAERNGLTLTDCVGQAWNDIKDRKGKMIDGVFVKEADL